MTELERICDDLQRDSNALAVLIMDADWQELARAGDANALALLRANASRLAVEREVIGRFDNADKRRAKKASEQLARLLA
jgi:hypothetical protein